MPDTDWIERPAVGIPTHASPNSYLGEEDAADEWMNPDQPLDTFLHTDAYRTFSRTDLSYLYGRRGTGKTSILHMLHYEVRNSKLNDYRYAWLIDDEETYLSLTMQVRTSQLTEYEDNELQLFLREKWKWAFRVAAMQGVIWEARQSNSLFNKNHEKIESFLTQAGLLNGDLKPSKLSALAKIVEITANEIEEADMKSLQLAGVVTRITRRLNSVDFDTANEALTKLLSAEDTFALVLIDSLEEYNITDRISHCNIAALLSAIADIYRVRDEKRVLVKVALPAEIYNHLTIFAHDKIARRFHFINWRQKDLISFVAKRYLRRLTRPEERSGSKYLNELKALENEKSATAFLYQHMPSTIETRQGVELDTLSYIVKHTQKKPRQLITILNSVLGLCEETDCSIESLSAAIIVKGIHTRSDALVKDALDIYGRLYKEAPRIARQTFVRRRNIFRWCELDKFIQQVSSLRNRSGLSADEVKQFFVEAGILGREARRTESGNVDYVEVEYEYQVKGVLEFSNDSVAVIHPMFYDEFESKVHRRSILFPAPYEEEELAALRAVRVNMGD